MGTKSEASLISFFFNIKDKTKDGRGRVGKKGVCLVNDRSVHNHKKTMHGGPLF